MNVLAFVVGKCAMAARLWSGRFWCGEHMWECVYVAVSLCARYPGVFLTPELKSAHSQIWDLSALVKAACVCVCLCVGVCVCARRLGFTCRLQTVHVQLSDLYLASVYPSVERIFLPLSHTHTHTQTQSTAFNKSQTDPLAPEPFPTHCRAHGSRIDGRVTPSNRCCACARCACARCASQRIVLLSPPLLVHRSGGEI